MVCCKNYLEDVSSWPVRLAKAPASLLTTLTTSSPQLPRDSTTAGMRVMPCLLQTSPVPRISGGQRWWAGPMCGRFRHGVPLQGVNNSQLFNKKLSRDFFHPDLS